MNVIGYLRVSTKDQEYGLDAQRNAIQAEADRRGWYVTWIEDAGRSGRDIKRPGMTRALTMLAAKDVDAIVVSKLDRLSRSLADFAHLLERAEKQGWAVVAIDLGIDTTTPTGELVANVMAAVSRWERRMIGVRTREGLAVARDRGVRLGAQVRCPADVAARIVDARAAGHSYARIADALNDDGVPTPADGAQWYPSSVRAVALRNAA